MKIAIYNTKGGVGKTSIALNLALSMDYKIVTNDNFSPLNKVLPESRVIKVKRTDLPPRLSSNDRVIFDLSGGFLPAAIESVKQSQWVIVPVTSDFIDIQTSINCINQLTRYNQNVIVVANKTEKQDFKNIASSIHRFFSFPVFNIKKSRALPNLFKGRKSIQAMCQDPKFPYKKQFGVIADQFNKLTQYMERKLNKYVIVKSA